MVRHLSPCKVCMSIYVRKQLSVKSELIYMYSQWDTTIVFLSAITQGWTQRASISISIPPRGQEVLQLIESSQGAPQLHIHNNGLWFFPSVRSSVTTSPAAASRNSMSAILLWNYIHFSQHAPPYGQWPAPMGSWRVLDEDEKSCVHLW